MAGNQKAIKLRIKSVQSTMQICKAMELVAASRLHKAMERAENSRPYFEALQGTLAQIAAENIDMMSIYTKEPQNDDWCFIVLQAVITTICFALSKNRWKVMRRVCFR